MENSVGNNNHGVKGQIYTKGFSLRKIRSSTNRVRNASNNYLKKLLPNHLNNFPINLWKQMYNPLLSGVAIIWNHQIIFCNYEFKRIFCNLPSTLNNFTLRRLHRQDIAMVWKEYLSLLKVKSGTAEITLRTRGSISSAKSDFIWVRCRANLMNYGSRRIIQVSVIDITELKRLEHQVIIKNKMLSLGKIAAGIAHEIRNKYASRKSLAKMTWRWSATLSGR